MHASKDKLTLIIATKNKPFVLAAVLKYYDSVKFPCRILIADESDTLVYRKHNAQVIKACRNLRINYYHGKIGGIFESYLFLLSRVKSEYVLTSGDDDFFNIKAIEKIVKFLDKNLDYTSAGGISVRIMATWNKPNNRFIIDKKINATTDNYVHNSAANRIFNYSERQKVITYNVVRTRAILNFYRIAKKNNFFQHILLTELLQNTMILAEGKNKLFLKFYHFWFMPAGGRDVNDFGIKTKFKDWFEKVNDPILAQATVNFISIVSRYLNRNHKWGIDVSREIAKSAWTSYTSKFYDRRHTETSIKLLKYLNDSRFRRKLYLYNIILFNKATRLYNFSQVFYSRNVFSELYTFFYSKTIFILGTMKLNDSVKILSYLNQENSTKAYR